MNKRVFFSLYVFFLGGGGCKFLGLHDSKKKRERSRKKKREWSGSHSMHKVEVI